MGIRDDEQTPAALRERAAALMDTIDRYKKLNNTFSIYQMRGGPETASDTEGQGSIEPCPSALLYSRAEKFSAVFWHSLPPPAGENAVPGKSF